MDTQLNESPKENSEKVLSQQIRKLLMGNSLINQVPSNPAKFRDRENKIKKEGERS